MHPSSQKYKTLLEKGPKFQPLLEGMQDQGLSSGQLALSSQPPSCKLKI